MDLGDFSRRRGDLQAQWTRESLVDDSWLRASFAHLDEEALDRLRTALNRAIEHLDACGEPLDHAIGTTLVAADLALDADSIIAALLHSASVRLPADQAEAQFGPVVARLIDGCSRLDQIRDLTQSDAMQAKTKDAEAQAEALRKMVLAMVEDIRAVLIALAERTQQMRLLARVPPETATALAHSTLQLFAPLANRLGVWQLKWELEDLSLRQLEPALYQQIARSLDERRTDRERGVAEIVESVKTLLREAGIEAEVTGRPKHIYSIWKKMVAKQLRFEQVFDVRAVRVLVDTIEQCYAALSAVHARWDPIEGEFDDYIANPKRNFYRSLHTAVTGPNGTPVEIQIRTHDMHQHAEYGVAAHWRYKEGRPAHENVDQKISLLRQILAWQQDVKETLPSVSELGFDESVFALTPQGRVIDLPRGATPLDFAYHVHTDLGHRCRGAKVDGHIVPLNTVLESGQRVEILTSKQGGPSRDWLSPNAGYLKSSRARAKVRHWFNNNDPLTQLTNGRAILERELQRRGIATFSFERLAQKLGFANVDELLIALTRDEVGARMLDEALEQPVIATPKRPPSKATATPGKAPGVSVNGIDGLMVFEARCCKPRPPDPIVGFVTLARGITVHRQDCRNIARVPADKRQRVLPAEWNDA